MQVPVRVVRWHLAKPCRYHLRTACFPIVLVGNVKDQQMIPRWSFADLMSSLRGELDVIGLLRMTENYAVKAAVIFKLSEHVEAKALRIHLGNRGQVVGRPDYSHRRTRLHSDARLISKPSSKI